MLFFLSMALAAPPDFPNRAEVVRALLALDPRVAEGDAMAAMARAEVVPSAVAPLHVTAGVAPASTMMFGAEVGVDWMLPGPRMRRLETDSAAAAARAAAADATMMRIEAAARWSQLVDVVWDLAAEGSVVAHHAVVLRDAADSVERRVATGLATPDQRVMAQMALVEVDEARLGLDRRAREAEALLDALARQNDGVLPAPAAALRAWTRATVPPPADPGPVLAAAAPSGLVAAAGAPAVLTAQAQLEAAHAMDGMARRGGAPMTEVMLSYSTMWDDPTMALMAGFGVNVPLDTAVLRAKRLAATEGVRAAEAHLHAERADSEAGVERAQAAVDEMAAMETFAVTRMAPLTAEALRLARTAYETNRGTLDAWLDAERADTDTAQKLAKARAERRQMEAMLAMARGELAGLPGVPADPTATSGATAPSASGAPR